MRRDQQTLTLWDALTKWIIPGVGNFKATAPLSNGELGAVLRDGVSEGRPLLGICLGLQWMFEGSTEAPELRGLGAFRGRVHTIF